jgi:hypothetical protein
MGKLGSGATPDELREKALAKFDARSVRLIDEIEAMLKLLVFQREALQNNLFSGLGYKQDSVDLKTVAASKELTLAYTRMVEAQIKLDKHLKQVADLMTPEEEREAVKKYILSLPVKEAGDLLQIIIKKHDARKGSGSRFDYDSSQQE